MDLGVGQLLLRSTQLLWIISVEEGLALIKLLHVHLEVLLVYDVSED
jgi:hypothetical protein